jgi:uncharacterized protein YbjT (DUF2867 family)
LDKAHAKMDVVVCDLLALEEQKDFKADHVFCCIGTTAKKTPDQDLYYKIDFGIPVAAARLAKKNGSSTYAVVSAIGADPKSSIFYSRTKGEMEEAVLAEDIPNTYIMQPAIIGGPRKEFRLGERIGLFFFGLLSPLLIGGLRKYRVIPAERIAKAMVSLALDGSEGGRIPSDVIDHLGRHFSIPKL